MTAMLTGEINGYEAWRVNSFLWLCWQMGLEGEDLEEAELVCRYGEREDVAAFKHRMDRKYQSDTNVKAA